MRKAVLAVACLALSVMGGRSPQAQQASRNVDPRQAKDISRRIMVLAMEDGRNPTAAELKLLIDLAKGATAERIDPVRPIAMRAIGRLERRDLIPVLLTLLQDARVAGSAASALVTTLRAHAGQAGDPEIDAAIDAVLRAPDLGPQILSYLPYTRADQVAVAEKHLMAILNDPQLVPPPYGAIASAMEVLARRHRRLHQLEDETVEFLKKAVGRSLPQMDPKETLAPQAALAALAAAGKAEEAQIKAALRDGFPNVRRMGVVALNSGGASIDPAVRTELIEGALRDTSATVRYEALGAWIRRETAANGCAPIVAAMSDDDVHVALAAIDALGEQCKDDEGITGTLSGEVRTPPTVGDWQRETHAFAAFAKRAPERIETSMQWFAGHQVWQVRMYAARAAAVLKDRETLQRLAYDSEDNVREAALPALRTLAGSESDQAFIAALGHPDYQLLRTAAMALKDAQPDKHLLAALMDAMLRVTAEKKDTSRDARMALLERIRAMGSRDQLLLYERLLKDFDPVIAAAAAAACRAVSTDRCVADPQIQMRPPPPTAGELTERVRAKIDLDNGRSFVISLNSDLAPLAVTRFARLVRARYYDGLTFHRVVPNFVIQGGSPGANEYVGDGPFMRDELGGSHRRGTVGISTRGRHTGDAQIFVNLVDNPRLNHDYTVFATVTGDGMDVVDRVIEGTRIRRIQLVPGR